MDKTSTETRKSSYVNARGIPTAAYQVLHLLSCTRWGTYPGQVQLGGGCTQGGVPPVRVPPHLGPMVWYPRWGTPLARSDWGEYLRWGTPHWGTPPARSDAGYLRWGTPCQGTPHLGNPPRLAGSGWGYPGWGSPPRQVWADKQSETITFPLVLRTRSVIIPSTMLGTRRIKQ